MDFSREIIHIHDVSFVERKEGREKGRSGTGWYVVEGRREGYLLRVYAARPRKSHTGVCIEMRNGADRPATITPIS